MKIMVFFMDGNHMEFTIPKGMNLRDWIVAQASAGFNTNEGPLGTGWRPAWSVSRVERIK